jgi:hypothetical protein
MKKKIQLQILKKKKKNGRSIKSSAHIIYGISFSPGTMTIFCRIEKN